MGSGAKRREAPARVTPMLAALGTTAIEPA